MVPGSLRRVTVFMRTGPPCFTGIASGERPSCDPRRRPASRPFLARTPSLGAVRPCGARLCLARHLSSKPRELLHALASSDGVDEESSDTQVDVQCVPAERAPARTQFHGSQLCRCRRVECRDTRHREGEEAAVAEFQHHAHGAAVVSRREGAQSRYPLARISRPGGSNLISDRRTTCGARAHGICFSSRAGTRGASRQLPPRVERRDPACRTRIGWVRADVGSPARSRPRRHHGPHARAVARVRGEGGRWPAERRRRAVRLAQE